MTDYSLPFTIITCDDEQASCPYLREEERSSAAATVITGYLSDKSSAHNPTPSSSWYSVDVDSVDLAIRRGKCSLIQEEQFDHGTIKKEDPADLVERQDPVPFRVPTCKPEERYSDRKEDQADVCFIGMEIVVSLNNLNV